MQVTAIALTIAAETKTVRDWRRVNILMRRAPAVVPRAKRFLEDAEPKRLCRC
jgi:hypothetical protein